MFGKLKLNIGLRLLKDRLQTVDTDSYYLLVLPEDTSEDEMRAVRRMFPDNMKIVIIAARYTSFVKVGNY